MIKKIVVDTNAILRFILNDVSSQAKQTEGILLKAKDKKIEIVAPQIVVFELQFALEKYYRFGKDVVIEKLKSIVSTSYIEIQDRRTFLSALNLYESTNLSFVDCFLKAFSHDIQSDLFTFDKKLTRN